VSPKEWRDTVALRLGAEYHIDRYAVRGGYAFDPTPVPRRRLDPTLPDGDRHVVSLGFGADLFAGLGVDAGVLWVLPLTRRTAPRLYEPELKGSFEVSAWVASLSLRWTYETVTAPVAAELPAAVAPPAEPAAVAEPTPAPAVEPEATPIPDRPATFDEAPAPPAIGDPASAGPAPVPEAPVAPAPATPETP
jgi:hypothetical protein